MTMATTTSRGRMLLACGVMLGGAALKEASGPGLRGPAVLDLALGRARSSDLRHVEPELFAAALQRDATRIFEFVRDRIAYESYPGLLRGPRGTLLAMAGNSVDRAALLASMLESAGRRVRFVAGRLPEERARLLAASVGSERPAAIQDAKEPASAPGRESLAARLRSRVEFEYGLVRRALEQAGVKAPERGPESLDEGPLHHWVQMEEGENWVDLDPSFSDAAPGRACAKPERTLEKLPESLATRVVVTLRVEEFTGDRVATRELLRFSSTIAELSGRGLFLVHVPENWKGPAKDVTSSIAAAIESTGRLKPILVAGDRWVAGEPFRQRPPTGAGLGGVRDLLGGASRKEPPLATAELLEIELAGPGGLEERIGRELFDAIGKGRRASGAPLTAAEAKAAAGRSQDQGSAYYDVFFTSGRIDAAHLVGIEPTAKAGAAPEGAAAGPMNVTALLRKINVALAAAADGLLPRVEDDRGGAVVFYPDSPRIQIVDLQRNDGAERLTIDLRRTRLIGRSVANSAKLRFEAQLLRGVFEGVLERTLGEFLSGDEPPARSFSTSTLVERAHADGVPILLLRPADVDQLADVSEDGRARLRESLADGKYAIGPAGPVAFGGAPRFAWWQLDPRSGEIVAMTDEGLHGDSTEHTLVAVGTNAKGGLIASLETYVITASGGLQVVARGVYEVLDEGALIDLMQSLGINNWSTMFVNR
jgi:hypothetical protein